MTDKTQLNFVPPSPSSEAQIMKKWKDDSNVMVSVICITYNHASFIETALNSILMQKTHFRYEILLRDDASTDGTSDIVRSYAEKYPNIVRAVIEPENTYSKGVTPWGVLFPMSKGKYLAHCEGDDYWTDNTKLEQQVSFLENNSDYVICYHDYFVIDDTSGELLASAPEKHTVDLTKEAMCDGVQPHTATRCYRNVLELPPEFESVKAGDIFVISLLSQFGQGKFLKSLGPSVYRKHEGGAWSGANQKGKREQMATTFFHLSAYYQRVGETSKAQRISLSALQEMVAALDISKAIVTKLFLKIVFPKFYDGLKRFKKGN